MDNAKLDTDGILSGYFYTDADNTWMHPTLKWAFVVTNYNNNAIFS